MLFAPVCARHLAFTFPVRPIDGEGTKRERRYLNGIRQQWTRMCAPPSRSKVESRLTISVIVKVVTDEASSLVSLSPVLNQERRPLIRYKQFYSDRSLFDVTCTESFHALTNIRAIKLYSCDRDCDESLFAYFSLHFIVQYVYDEETHFLSCLENVEEDIPMALAIFSVPISHEVKDPERCVVVMSHRITDPFDADADIYEYLENSIEPWMMDSVNVDCRKELEELLEHCTKLDSIPLTDLRQYSADDLGFYGTIGLFTVKTVSIPTLPIELLDLILDDVYHISRYSLEEVWQEEFSNYSSVCRVWRELLKARSYEFHHARQKLAFFKRIPVFQKHWSSLHYDHSDLKNNVSLNMVILTVRIYQPLVSSLSLVYPLLKERSLLFGLADLNTIKTLNLIGWDEFTVIYFLLNSRSRRNLSWIELKKMHTPLSSVHATEDDLEHMALRRLLIEFASGFFMTSFFDVTVQTAELHIYPHSPISTFSVQQLQALKAFTIKYAEDSAFDVTQVAFDKPLMVPNCQLSWLSIDGGHENSNILPEDFFQRINEGRLRHLYLSYCLFSFHEFLDFIRVFFRAKQSDEVKIILFYGQWTDDEALRAKEIGGEQLAFNE
ncbi:hypothetical protein BT69DRAFT_1384720 [Atractiella rhizophila]|nr:hypothetical protein BT69DRAFT_1384720 [Atractiella rhizophila]